MCSSASAAVEGVIEAAGGAGEEILALVELIDGAQAALAERTGSFDAAEGWAADGAYSFACWLRARADVTRAESLQLGRFARTLRTMPVTEAAVADGKLSVAKARLLAGMINDRTAERFAEQEGFLVDQVQSLTVDDAKVALDYWKRLADADGPDPSDPTRNWARVTVGYHGRWNVEADLDPASGAILKAVLDAIVDRMHQDGRFSDRTGDNTASRRDADGLIEMAIRASGPHPDQPSVHPDIVVIVPEPAVAAGEPDPFHPPVIVGAGPVCLNDVLRLATIGTVSTLTVDDLGRPLNLGRKQRLASHAQWIALTIRDHGCVTPGCDRPAAWCQSHHLRWWERDGGATDLDNLALVCSYHHHLIHDAGWKLTPRPDATWHLTRPDGSDVDAPRYSTHPART
ncbi:MAG TPA: DUF222 domain-containing protein, partial [Acidimicrobiales bacterium]|nr:DUF222 domain-containing protein [Acidimicrobiales bacterium]